MGSMVERAELGPRKSAVLHAIVEEYVRTGEPVGSETITERAGIGVSSATIRNEMAALEELGYLTHPHTSAGRIPTDIGYRHYVDSLPAGGRLRDAQRRAIASYFAEAILDLEEVLKGSVQLLSRLTQYAGLAVPPSVAEEPIVRLELIDMGPTMMVLAVGSARPRRQADPRSARGARRSGAARDGAPPRRAPRDDVHGGAGAAAEAGRRGGARAARPVAQRGGDAPHRAAGRERGSRRGRRRVEPGRRGAGVAPGDAPAPVRDARTRAGHHARPAGRELGPPGLAVTIGTEHPTTGEWDASLVTAPFKVGDATLGTIGVVGPTRMDYLSAMASVRAVARRLSELATELDG